MPQHSGVDWPKCCDAGAAVALGTEPCRQALLQRLTAQSGHNGKGPHEQDESCSQRCPILALRLSSLSWHKSPHAAWGGRSEIVAAGRALVARRLQNRQAPSFCSPARRRQASAVPAPGLFCEAAAVPAAAPCCGPAEADSHSGGLATNPVARCWRADITCQPVRLRPERVAVLMLDCSSPQLSRKRTLPACVTRMLQPSSDGLSSKRSCTVKRSP
mmetsp:Transcript_73152/g.236636  ORF Transcript_73152/g.236636 Transcript_73152/m.236636 type:complete len:216 (+) Transcript_73152:641-1288(+)